MTLLAELQTYLKENVGVAAVVAGRVFPQVAPTDADFPYITYQQLTNNSEHHMLAAAAIARPLVQINCWARSALVSIS